MSVESPNGASSLLKRIAALSGLAILALTQMGNECAGGGFEPDPSQPSCFDDSDCFEGDLCLSGECVVTCESDSDCHVGSVCSVVPRQDGTVQTCVANDGGSNVEDVECVSDAECQLANMRAACSVDGLCFIPETVTALLIEDLTPEAATVDPVDGEPGADIAAVYLVDADDRIVAYGDTVTAREPGGERVLSPILGESPMLGPDGLCVDGELPDAAASLGGEGGYILVRFVDLDGAPVASAPETWRVVVIEWSENCDPSITEDPESVRVSGCVGTSYESLEFGTDCNVPFGQPFAGKALLTADDT